MANGEGWNNFTNFINDNSEGLWQVGGMGYEQFTQGQQMANQQELMEIGMQNEMQLMNQQMGNQMALNQQGNDLQFDLWNKTNYGAQMEHMKKAGLNPALMYGKGAGQGGSTGSQTGGSAAKGSPTVPQAPKRPEFELYGLQAKMMEAQIDDLESQKNKRDGADTAETKSRTALNEQETKAAASKIKVDKAQIEQANANTSKVLKEIEMDYSDNFGKTWWVNAEKVLSGDLDTSTYIGAAMLFLGLLPLRNPAILKGLMRPKAIKGFAKEATKRSGKVAAIIGIGAAGAIGNEVGKKSNMGKGYKK